MSVTDKEFRTLSRLAKLEISEENKAEFIKEFEEIIALAGKVCEAVTGDTESIREVGGESLPLNDLRTDCVKESFSNEKITSGTEARDGYFPVKRVVK